MGNFRNDYDTHLFFYLFPPLYSTRIFLAKLIERLERKDIPGLIQNPKTQASCISNLRKIIRILGTRNDFNQELLDEQELFRANNSTILRFLRELKKVYQISTIVEQKSQIFSNSGFLASGSKILYSGKFDKYENFN